MWTLTLVIFSKPARNNWLEMPPLRGLTFLLGWVSTKMSRPWRWNGVSPRLKIGAGFLRLVKPPKLSVLPSPSGRQTSSTPLFPASLKGWQSFSPALTRRGYAG